jgi:hypothetical protein
MPVNVLADLRRLEPLARKTSPLNVLPPRKTRFGSPLVLSRVHWLEQTRQAMLTPSGKNEFDRRLGNFRVQIKLDGEGERVPTGCRCNLVVVNIVKTLSIGCIAI